MNNLVINDSDNVFIALNEDQEYKRGHKYALRDINKGDEIIKYGHRIGYAGQNISKGDHVHTHNVSTSLGNIVEYKYREEVKENKEVKEDFGVLENKKVIDKTFKAYERPSGEVGVRNELWIIPTVGCVNGVATAIIESFKERCLEEGISLKKMTNFDGVYTFPHNYGCSQMGDDHLNTKKTLQNIVKHPNAGGVLVLGLGCENNQIDSFKKTLGSYNEERVLFMNSQDVEDEIESGLNLLWELFERMQKDQRTKQALSKLRIGLECGGSDGLSGVTANPMVGVVSDYIVDAGGTTVLTEVPEMFGGETILMNRCINESTFDKTVKMVNGFKDYYKRHGQVIYENPSPGNKKKVA